MKNVYSYKEALKKKSKKKKAEKTNDLFHLLKKKKN